MRRPRLLITRPLPARLHARAGALLDLAIRKETGAARVTELSAALYDHDVILPLRGETFLPATFSHAPSLGCSISVRRRRWREAVGMGALDNVEAFFRGAALEGRIACT